jgi:repressor LexA
MEDLTARQRQVLDFIVEALKDRGYPPSIREICREFDFSSTRAALRHLEALEKKGFISRAAGARAIRVLGSPRSAYYLPLVGEVPAGPLRYASEEVEEWIPVTPRLGGPGRFILRVRGDSMIGDGIKDGDLVVVDPQVGAEEGQVVVALVDGEATVKRLHRLKKAVELRPSNPAYDPIRIGEGQAEVSIAGKVVGLLRDTI